MAAPHPSTWLMTGASSGFGKSIAVAALQAGHKVLGTSRNIQSAESSFPEFSSKGGIWIQLDPGHPDAHKGFANASQKHDIDVLVNNAGYAFIGGVEDTSEQEVRDQMEVNFYGPLRAVRACLPVMRAKQCGHIVLISSGAGFIARPGRATYSASKFAIEAIHEALSHELSSFPNINVLIVEPGAFRTPFAARLRFPAAYPETGMSDGYKDTPLEAMIKMSRNSQGFLDAVRGDADKAGKEIVRAVDGGHGYLRMMLGKDCVAALEMKVGELKRDLEGCRAVALDVDVD